MNTLAAILLALWLPTPGLPMQTAQPRPGSQPEQKPAAQPQTPQKQPLTQPGKQPPITPAGTPAQPPSNQPAIKPPGTAQPGTAQPGKTQPGTGAQPPIAPPGQTGTSSTGAPARAVSPTGPFANADELLTALETADRALRTLTADLVYDRSFALQGDRQVRRGRLYFTSSPTVEQVAPARMARRFAIRFDELFVGTRQEKEVKFFVFDGEWLVEKLPAQKVFVKRQIVPPGQPFDPLKIGEGPLPIPIGQRKSEILSLYNAELLAPEKGLTDDKEIAFVRGSQQLRLTPRAELKRDSEFLEIRLWYRAGREGVLLPRMARTLNQAEDESLVQLVNVKLNDVSDIPPDLFDTSTPPTGWDVKVQPWREGPANVRDTPAMPETDVVDNTGVVQGPRVLPAAPEQAPGKADQKPPARTPR